MDRIQYSIDGKLLVHGRPIWGQQPMESKVIMLDEPAPINQPEEVVHACGMSRSC